MQLAVAFYKVLLQNFPGEVTGNS